MKNAGLPCLIAFVLLASCTASPPVTSSALPVHTPQIAEITTAPWPTPVAPVSIAPATITNTPRPTSTETPTSTSNATNTPQPTSTAIPSATPTPTSTPFPWVEQRLIVASNPVTFDNIGSSDYRHYLILGSATDVQGAIQVRASIEAIPGAAMPSDGSNGIWIFNGINENDPGSEAFFVGYQGGAWVLVSKAAGRNGVYDRILRTSSKSCEFSLILGQDGKTISVSLAGAPDTYATLDNPFGDRLVIKAQAAPTSSLKLGQLSISQLPKADSDRKLAGFTLRELAEKRGISIGALIGGDDWTDPTFTKILQQEFNLYLEHSLMQIYIDQSGYAAADSATRFAGLNGLRIRAHPILWWYDVPEWLKSGDFSPEKLRSVMQNRITTLLVRYPEISEWVVVNEAVWYNQGKSGYSACPWYATLGPQYIDMAFQYARQANPKAVLIYNDFDIELPGPKTELVYKLLQDMKARGTPIDGIGMQFHVNASIPPMKSAMIANMKRFGELGVGVYITELDVNLLGLPGTKEQKWIKQAQIYHDIVAACLESGVCKEITIFGVSDKYSWLLHNESHPGFYTEGEAPLIFDDNYKPKPAYFAIQDALLGK